MEIFYKMEIIQAQDENIAMDETFQKLKFILSQKQTAKDYLYKYQLKILFIPKEDSFELAFDKESKIAKLITKLVDILHIIFEMPIDERQNFYRLYVRNIMKDIKFNKILTELESHQSFDILFENPKLSNLFKIISDALD